MQVDRRCALLSGWAEMCANAPWMELRGGASKSWPVRKIAKPRHTVRRMAAASLPPDSGEVDAGPRQEEEAGRACMGYPASKERKIAGVPQLLMRRRMTTPPKKKAATIAGGGSTRNAYFLIW